jgi:hypothetical protein
MAVWVTQLEAADGSAWTSVHDCREGAEARLAEKIVEWGLGHQEGPEVRSYSICRYEVESY